MTERRGAPRTPEQVLPKENLLGSNHALQARLLNPLNLEADMNGTDVLVIAGDVKDQGLGFALGEEGARVYEDVSLQQRGNDTLKFNQWRDNFNIRIAQIKKREPEKAEFLEQIGVTDADSFYDEYLFDRENGKLKSDLVGFVSKVAEADAGSVGANEDLIKELGKAFGEGSNEVIVNLVQAVKNIQMGATTFAQSAEIDLEVAKTHDLIQRIVSDRNEWNAGGQDAAEQDLQAYLATLEEDEVDQGGDEGDDDSGPDDAGKRHQATKDNSQSDKEEDGGEGDESGDGKNLPDKLVWRSGGINVPPDPDSNGEPPDGPSGGVEPDSSPSGSGGGSGAVAEGDGSGSGEDKIPAGTFGPGDDELEFEYDEPERVSPDVSDWQTMIMRVKSGSLPDETKAKLIAQIRGKIAEERANAGGKLTSGGEEDGGNPEPVQIDRPASPAVESFVNGDGLDLDAVLGEMRSSAAETAGPVTEPDRGSESSETGKEVLSYDPLILRDIRDRLRYFSEVFPHKEFLLGRDIELEADVLDEVLKLVDQAGKIIESRKGEVAGFGEFFEAYTEQVELDKDLESGFWISDDGNTRYASAEIYELNQMVRAKAYVEAIAKGYKSILEGQENGSFDRELTEIFSSYLPALDDFMRSQIDGTPEYESQLDLSYQGFVERVKDQIEGVDNPGGNVKILVEMPALSEYIKGRLRNGESVQDLEIISLGKDGQKPYIRFVVVTADGSEVNYNIVNNKENTGMEIYFDHELNGSLDTDNPAITEIDDDLNDYPDENYRDFGEGLVHDLDLAIENPKMRPVGMIIDTYGELIIKFADSEFIAI